MPSLRLQRQQPVSRRSLHRLHLLVPCSRKCLKVHDLLVIASAIDLTASAVKAKNRSASSGQGHLEVELHQL
jgi:hypothetical protein